MGTVDIMLDLETLGTAPGSVVLAIGAVASVPPEQDPYFNEKISITSSLYCGLTVDPETLAWWRKQSKAAWQESVENGRDIRESLEAFSSWIERQRSGNHIRLWGDASTFDLVLLACAYRAAGVAVPWSYREEYCYRTLRNLLNSKKPASKLAHSAVSDAAAQMEHLQVMLLLLPKTEG
ncbi:MAG TPA: 3'-5' exonuclease [Candidatus Limnocylindrales bacterium]|nr:3'-5' exonuclease [Candidatus Limnocylindrales bacterium]